MKRSVIQGNVWESDTVGAELVRWMVTPDSVTLHPGYILMRKSVDTHNLLQQYRLIYLIDVLV
jgi:hypothetical protein